METGTKVVLDLEQCTNASYVKGRQARIKNKYEKHLKSPTHLKQLHIAEVRRTGFYCDLCGYETCDKSNFQRHLTSERHQRKTTAQANAGVKYAKGFDIDARL